jgi:hypothetical protein
MRFTKRSSSSFDTVGDELVLYRRGPEVTPRSEAIMAAKKKKKVAKKTATKKKKK